MVALAVRKDVGGPLGPPDGAGTPLQVDSQGNLRVSVTAGGTGGGPVEDGVDPLIRATVLDLANSNPLAVQLRDPNGDYVAAGGGTQYTEDVAAAANPIGNMLIARRRDVPAAETTTDGDNTALNCSANGELYTKILEPVVLAAGAANIGDVDIASPLAGGKVDVNIGSTSTVQPVNDNGGSLTVDGSVTVSGVVDTELTTADMDTGGGTDTRAVVGLVLAASGGGLLVGSANPMPATATGAAAHDAAVSGNPVLTGAEARVTLGTAVAEGDAVRIAANRYGFLFHTAIVPSRASSNGTPITATTTSVIAAPSAGSHLRVLRIHLSNGGATSTWISVRDGASGTQFYRTFLPQNGVLSINLNASGPLDLTTATRLDLVLSAAGSVEYTIDYLTVAD